MTIENFSIHTIIDQRRVDLLNDPNYGVILGFFEKYRLSLALPCYPFQLLEDHLLCYEGKIPSRLIDLHFTLLKRISIVKNAQHDQFDSIITRFAARFDRNDREHLSTTGYLQSDIPIKIRILKNLLESQFDLNQTFRKILIDQSSHEIRSLPTGRDRFGAYYWFFMDENGFVRLFRENVDVDRTWINVVKDRDELEKFIGLLITDTIVRKKFSDWNITNATFASLSPSDAFEQCYLPIPIEIPTEKIELLDVPIRRKRGRPKGSINIKTNLSVKKVEETNCQLILNDERTIDLFGKKKHENDQISIDDLSLAVRRSTRLQKTLTIKSTIKRKSIAVKKNKKQKTSSSRSRRYKSTSSSDYFDSDDSLSDLCPSNTDDHFFDLDDDDNSTTIESIRSAKTAHTSTITTLCYVCSKNDRSDVLLLCDSCDDAYHLECLRPILLSVPDDNWFCPLCEHKRLGNFLIEKFEELTNNFRRMEMKRLTKKSFQRKIRSKEYSSDESVTASESDHEITDSSYTLHMNENSNNISQRGRYRRTRFDIQKLLNTHDDNDDQQIIDFDLKLPEKIMRLIHRRDRNIEQHNKRISSHSDHLSTNSNDSCELNEKLGSPLVYVTSENQSCPMKFVITNAKQTSQITRRWNDVQRRSRLKLINPPITSHYTDENSNFELDNTSSIHRHQESISLIPIDVSSSRNIFEKVEATFDRLTRDIQYAVNEAHSIPTIKINDQIHVKRIQKKLLSPFITKNPHAS